MLGIGEIIMTVLLFLITAVLVVPWLLILLTPLFVLCVVPLAIMANLLASPILRMVSYIAQKKFSYKIMDDRDYVDGIGNNSNIDILRYQNEAHINRVSGSR